MGAKQSIPIWPPPATTLSKTNMSPINALNTIIPATVSKSNLTFIRRAEGSMLEDKLEILFNLLLVKVGQRPAYLLEGGNYSEIGQLAKQIKTIYPEFQQTIESETGGDLHRVFIHIAKLIPPFGDKDDLWIAENLGFRCKGLPDSQVDRVTISYYLEAKGQCLPIYTEICPAANMSEEFFEIKLDNFNEVAHSLNWNVKLEIKNWRADPLSYFANRIQEDQLDHKDVLELLEVLDGFGITLLKDNVDKQIWTIDQLQSNRKLLLFCTLWAMADPFSIYYPMSFEDAQILDAAVFKSFSKLGSDPLLQFEALFNDIELQRILSAQPEKLENVREKFKELTSTYLSSLRFMSK